MKAEHRKTYHIVTFGCQMNAHDSEKLAGILQNMGYSLATDTTDAGLVVFNTCCVRENAENKVYGHLGYMKHLRQTNPGLLVAVGGCMPQQESAMQRLIKDGAADIIFGTHNLHTFGELLTKAVDGGERVSEIWSEAPEVHSEYLATVRETPWRSGINIMYGCDNYCSYCIVPYVRGRERSREVADILAEARALLDDGVVEIMLLGQNVNSYAYGFPALLRELSKLGAPRIRFMTSHPKDLSRELIAAVKECDNICRHIHLPVQSGSNNVLAAMNRGYSREHYLNILEDLRREMPDMTVTTDIIVGFPGESEADFADTLDLVRRARFGGAFTFLYSKRTGTKAADMDKQVDADVANERFMRLLDTLNPIALEINKDAEGKTVRVLVDKLDKNTYTGRADNNLPVHFPNNPETTGPPLLGQIVPVRITQAKTFFLIGELS